jgi:hypothetical protein
MCSQSHSIKIRNYIILFSTADCLKFLIESIETSRQPSLVYVYQPVGMDLRHHTFHKRLDPNSPNNTYYELRSRSPNDCAPVKASVPTSKGVGVVANGLGAYGSYGADT